MISASVAFSIVSMMWIFYHLYLSQFIPTIGGEVVGRIWMVLKVVFCSAVTFKIYSVVLPWVGSWLNGSSQVGLTSYDDEVRNTRSGWSGAQRAAAEKVARGTIKRQKEYHTQVSKGELSRNLNAQTTQEDMGESESGDENEGEVEVSDGDGGGADGDDSPLYSASEGRSVASSTSADSHRYSF